MQRLKLALTQKQREIIPVSIKSQRGCRFVKFAYEDDFRSFPLSKQTENKFDGDAHAPNDGFTAKNFGVHCYAFEKCLVDHCYWSFRYSSKFIRQDIVDSKRLGGHAIKAQLAAYVEIVSSAAA